MIFHVDYVKASDPLDPNPTGTPLEDGYWNFDVGDIYAWVQENYKDELLMSPYGPPVIVNVSEITYEAANFDDAISEYFYTIKLKLMFWNGTTNSLQEFSDKEPGYGVAINFTNEEIYSSANLNIPFFIPTRDTGELALQWCADAYNKTMFRYNFKTKINVDATQRKISIADDNMVDINFNFTFKYDPNGVLENSECFVQFAGEPLFKEIFKRTDNLNPLDDIKWSVKKGDVIYVGVETDEYKIDIDDIINYTYENGWTTQIIAANVSIWDFTNNEWQLIMATEDINDIDKIFVIGEASEYYIPPPHFGRILYPIGTTGEKLAKLFTDTLLIRDVCNFDYVDYGDFWIYIEDTSTGKYNYYQYFPNGIIKYHYEEFELWSYDIYEEVGINSGDEFIWEITDLDEDAMESVFGVDWADVIQYNFGFGVGADDLGARMQKYIYEVWETDDGWEINEAIWNWTTEDFGGEPDLDYVEQFLYLDPKMLEVPPIWFCPKYDEDENEIYSVEEYLDSIEYDLAWENEGNKVWLNMSDVGYNANITIIYDEITGATQTLQIMDEFSDIIYKIQLDSYVYDPHWEDDSDYPIIMYYKNVTSLITGLNQVNFTASGIGMMCNFTIDIETNDDTEVIFSSFTDNPTDAPLDDAILYFDLFISDPSKIDFPINITIEIPESLVTSSKILKIYYYNDTEEEWQEVDYSIDGNKITITIYHTSIFSLTATDSGAGAPALPGDDDGGNGENGDELSIFGYNIIVIIAIISFIVVVLAKKRYKKVK